LLALVGKHVEAFFHAAGKKGALASIGLALLGFLQLTSIIAEPVTGFISLWVLLLVLLHRYSEKYTLKYTLPFRFPAVLFSALIGSIIFYSMAAAKISITPMPTHLTDNYVVAGYPRAPDFYSIFGKAIVKFGPIAISYAVLVNIGDMTVLSQAKSDGDDYHPSLIMVSDAIFTIVSGIFGGAIQTTLYIGHTTYKKSFKCRSFYTIAQGIFFGVGGLLGYISFLTEILPKPAILPIFIYVAFEIVGNTFYNEEIKPEHAPAIILAFFPGIAQFAQIVLSQLYSGQLLDGVVHPEIASKLGLSDSIMSTISSIIQLAHGFIMTSLLWGSALAFIIDRNYRKASAILLMAAVFAFFGVIHSVQADAGVYLPWKSGSYLPYHWTAAYGVAAVFTFLSKYMLLEDVSDD